MRRSRIKFVVLAALVSLAGGASAQSLSPAAGRVDPIDNLGGTARAVGMGSAFAGVASDASAILWNPAGLSALESPDLSLNHNSWLAQTFQEELLLGMPLPGGGLGLSVHYLGYGTFEGRDANGFPASSYSADQIGMGLGWGQRVVGGLSAGVALHVNQQTLAGTSTFLLGADMGLMYKTQSGWSFGASCENLGLGSTSQALASSIRLGVSRLWKEQSGTSFLVALGGDIAPSEANSVQAGGEFSYHSVLFLRAGYNLQLQNTGFSGVQGLTGGAGIQIGSIKLDYAFVPYGELGNVNLVSLGYSFGEPPTPAASANHKQAVPQTSTLPAVSQTVPAPITVIVQQSGPAPQQVQPQPVLEGKGTSERERTITMEFEVPAEEGVVRAKALAKAGQWNDAALALGEVLRKNPNDAAAWQELGNIYFQVGPKESAVYCFERVLKLRPDDKSLADWLERYKVK